MPTAQRRAPRRAPIVRDPDMTTRQVSEDTGYAETYLRKLRQRGEGPKWRKLASGAIRYRKSDVDAWMER